MNNRNCHGYDNCVSKQSSSCCRCMTHHSKRQRYDSTAYENLNYQYKRKHMYSIR